MDLKIFSSKIKWTYYPLFFIHLFLKFTIILAFVTTNNSCGIYSFSGASLSPEVKTISISTFTNQASLVVPSLAETLTEKLKDKFLKELSLTLVDYDGDIEFKGAITDYRTVPTSIQSNDQAAMTRLTINVRVTYKNTIEPKQNYETIFSNYVDFDSSQDISSIEDELIEELTEMLIQDIFNKAVNNW